MSRGWALITGCGKGSIGGALAEEFSKQGYKVLATVLPFESREHLQKEGTFVFNTDVTSEESVQELAKHVADLTGGRLDVLVNNAGICYTMPTTDTDIAEVEKMFRVNVFGPMRMVRYFSKALIASKGCVVNIGSVGGIVPYIYGASYNATKAALHHYGNTLRAEMKPFGVRVINVISGEVETNILKSDFGRTLPADSPFAPISDLFTAHCQRNPSGRTSRENYASGVVAQVMKPNPPAWFWHGSRSGTVRLLDAVLPRTIWDSMFWKEFQFDKLVAALADAKEPTS